jgi:hypothetical protein
LNVRIVSAQRIRVVSDWNGVLDALHDGHSDSRSLGDSCFIGDAAFGVFSHGVILPGKGAGFKLASLCPANLRADLPLPTEQAAFIVVDERTKSFVAMLDGLEITRFALNRVTAIATRRASRPRICLPPIPHRRQRSRHASRIRAASPMVDKPVHENAIAFAPSGVSRSLVRARMMPSVSARLSQPPRPTRALAAARRA